MPEPANESSFNLLLKNYLQVAPALLLRNCDTTPRHQSISFQKVVMYVQRASHIDDLQLYRHCWDKLAGDCVFRSWTWLTTWWKHYGLRSPRLELATLLVFADNASNCRANSGKPADAEQPVAILPVYVEHTLARGRALHLLGDGEVCSDHLGLLVKPSYSKGASKALADYLTNTWANWDLLDLSAIDADDAFFEAFLNALEKKGCHLSRTAGLRNWVIALPESWESFLAQQSRSHRKQLRRLEKRVLQTKQASWHLADGKQEFEVAWDILTDLHQRRRRSLGEPGCFASERWADFHRDVADQLHAAGQLRISWMELEDQPIAAEYHFAGKRTTFAYQGGIDPSQLEAEPGRLSMICTIQNAIAEGHNQFDLLRGDEAYKAHWRATPYETYDVQVIPARTSAMWRFRARSYLRRAESLARSFTLNF